MSTTFKKNKTGSFGVPILRKLIWEGKSKWQIIGASIGSFIGLFLLLISLQLYLDMTQLVDGNTKGAGQYIQINKQVSLFNTLGAKSFFTNEDFEDIKALEYVDGVAPFVSNKFKVSASSSLLGFYTELFFEAVPNEFLDIPTDDFKWEPGQNDLPMIISKDYLALYNFGFAPSQGLPQFTQSTIKRVTLDINVGREPNKQVFQGRIAGFSDRINSILVPENFMTYANQRFGQGAMDKPSRVIMKIDNTHTKEMAAFIDDNGYEVSSGRLIGEQVSTLLRIIISIIGGIGMLITLLSVLVFILNFQLIISRSSEDIKLLLQLGYKNKRLSWFLFTNLVIIFAVILILTFAILLILRGYFVDWFAVQGFELPRSLHLLVYLTAGIFTTSFLIANFMNINWNVISLFHNDAADRYEIMKSASPRMHSFFGRLAGSFFNSWVFKAFGYLISIGLVVFFVFSFINEIDISNLNLLRIGAIVVPLLYVFTERMVSKFPIHTENNTPKSIVNLKKATTHE